MIEVYAVPSILQIDGDSISLIDKGKFSAKYKHTLGYS